MHKDFVIIIRRWLFERALNDTEITHIAGKWSSRTKNDTSIMELTKLTFTIIVDYYF